MSARKTRVFHKLQIVAHKLQKLADREISSVTDLTTSQAAVLSILVNDEGRNQRDVAAALSQNESAITAMIGRLQRLNYIVKQRSRTDGRAWELTVTSRGRETLNATKKPFLKVNKAIENELSEAEVVFLADILARLSDAID